MSPLGPRRGRALSCLLSLVVAPITVATFPAAASAAPEPSPRAASARVMPAEPLLPGPARGRQAIRQLGDDLPAAAALNDLRPARLRTLLRTDDAVWVDPRGAVYYVDPPRHDETHESHEGETHESHEAELAEAAPSSQVAPLTETFALHSNPGASRTILLDFDGAHVSGSWWNDPDMGVLPATHPAWDPAGDGPAFNDSERRMIQQIWAMVAEDFAPFDVDVTTEDPGEAGLTRSSSSDTVYGTRVLITPSLDPAQKICQGGCGGVAYMDVFDKIGSQHQPAWVFPQSLQHNPKSIAEAATHEAGHNLGLKHDGGSSSPDYYLGHGIWAPIMGAGYSKPLVQWSAGHYPGANNQQDDVSILTRYLGARPDEAPASVATPSPLPEGTAYIGTRHDEDAYLLGSCTPGSVVDVQPAAVAPNLDVRAALHDAGGTERVVAAPSSGGSSKTVASGLGATLTVPTNGGPWVVTVEGAGEGSWSNGGYDDYGSLGAYTVSAPGCQTEAATGVPSAPRDATTSAAQTDSLTLQWSAPASDGDGPVTSYVVTRSGSGPDVNETLSKDARSHTFTGLTAGTTYQLSVRAANAHGVGPTTTVSASTSAAPATAPSAPRTVTGSYDPEQDTLDVWWSEPESSGTEPISGYLISLDGDTVGQVGAATRSVEITMPSGSAGTYVVGVAAVSAVGRSPVSTVSVDVTRAGTDTEAPVLTSFDFTPTTVDVTDGPREITVTARLTDATGANPPNILIGSADATLSAGFGILTRVTGTATDGVYRRTVTIPQGTEPGRWSVTLYPLEDSLGNSDGTFRSHPTDLTVTRRSVATVPEAPARPRVERGDRSARVSWTSPSDGGSPITGYTVTSSPGGITTTVPADTTSTVVGGLTNRTAYTFTVIATNAVGDSAASVRSDQVIPRPAASAPKRMKPPRVVVRGRRAVVRWQAARPNGSRVKRYLVDISRVQGKRVRPRARRTVFRGLEPGRYRVRVAARNAVGRSPYSRWVRVRVR